ncbi:hypothetical protein KSP40_PGU008445 [Platanthera guangdongensis]|uniref:Uncharacterized protein n=1 Tax=Platanthera guangdongensis TaxID=2320717 RepID=A0ABR2LU30_9ASPA
MRETVLSYPDLVHRIEAQFAADKAIEAHRQQFDGKQKHKREKDPTPQHQDRRFREKRRNGQRRHDHQRDQPPRDYNPLNTMGTNMLYAIQNKPTLHRLKQLAHNPKT